MNGWEEGIREEVEGWRKGVSLSEKRMKEGEGGKKGEEQGRRQ